MAKTKKVWDDWWMALVPFHKSLLKIGAHIREHDFVDGAELYAAQVDEADRLYKEWRKALLFSSSQEEVDQAWWAYWIYVGEHLQRWWD